MAALVSHAMRRFPTTPPDTSHSSYKLSKLRGESSRQESGESALSRSMRYADPWLYGSVPPTNGGLLLAPALVLCACHDYINGTAKSRSGNGKKSPTTCKKCKGTRLPLSTLESTYKFGTVRCYPTAAIHQSSNPHRAGTVRVTSTTSRPSILPITPSPDPYDVMRRSRLSGTHERARSISPKNKIKTDSKTLITSKSKGNKPESYNSTFGRKSILECDINPYELVSSDDFKQKEQDITLVNGQRIRVRSSLTDKEYEDIQIRQVTPTRTAPPTPKEKNLAFTFSDVTATKLKRIPKIKSPLSSPKLSDNDLSGRFKSILKKPSTFGDSDSSSNVDRTPSPSRKTGAQKSSQFYLPTPLVAPRKKVQFLMTKDQEAENETNLSLEENIQVADTNEINYEPKHVSKSEPKYESELQAKELKEEKTSNESQETIIKSKSDFSKSEAALRRACLIKRSLSDTVMMEQKKIQFNDTMALRNQRRKAVCSSNFNETRTIAEVPKENNTVNESTKSSLTTSKTSVFDDEYAAKISSETKLSDEENKSVANTVECSMVESITKDEQSLKADPENIIEATNIENSAVQVPIYEEVPKAEPVKPTEEEMMKKLEKCLATEIYSNLETLNAPIFISESPPPSVPPRKRSNNRQPQIKIPSPPAINKIRIESFPPESPNATIVQVNSPPVSPLSPTVHRIQIKNEYPDSSSIDCQNVLENPQRKTSILINGDDCYSTVNVSNNVPLYQSSVVVNDTSSEHSPRKPKKNSSTVYITGTFCSNDSSPTETLNNTNGTSANRNIFNITAFDTTRVVNGISTNQSDEVIETERQDNINNLENNLKNSSSSSDCRKKTETEEDNPSDILAQDIEQSQFLNDVLRDPVEAVRRNLVPHVCGKSDVSRRPHDKRVHCKIVPNISRREQLEVPPLEEGNITQNSLEESFLRLRNYEAVCEDGSSEHSSSTQYELMDGGSECYTDHSNRSSLTEEEMANRTKFYEMLADSAIIELSESEDHQYESIKMNNDPIYEEIEIPPPLPSNPPPPLVIDDFNLDKEFTTRSIFEGASKYDILSYLVDAKERGIVQEDNFNDNYNNTSSTVEEETKESYNKISELTTVSDSYEDNSLTSNPLIDDKATFQKTAEVERNDSGVGSETSKSSLSKYRLKPEISILCEDCEAVLENKIENEPLLCRKCLKKRSERKEIITEIVETEEKYSRDLQIILEEFYQPMLVAGLLTPEQLSAIFLNVEELLENSQALAERLRDAVEIAQEQGDDDLLTVNIGKLFLESTPMLHAFETYCVRQGAASLLLASLEKEKELLRIFLRVSQMENTMLRRMNLNSFLMVPVQRVTKYPLLLSRLYKVTPGHHDYRDELKDAQHKIELHLNHMNSETKDVPSKLWRRIGSSSGRRSSAEMDLVNIKLRKIAVDVLEWNHEEAKFILEGKLLFTQPTDNNWRKGRTIKLTPINALLVINGKPSSNKAERTDENGLIFAKPGTKEAALLLVRDKNGRYSLLREPLYLDRCVIAADPAWQSYFEVQELMGKDTFIFKAECEELTQTWYKQLQYHAQGMGSWRKRRNALANIMINGMGLRS